MVATIASTLRTVAVGILAGCLCLLVAPATPAQNRPEQDLDELWQEYPLEPRTTTSDARPAQPKPAPPVPTTASDGGTDWTPAAIAVGGAVLVLLASGAVLAAARRRPTPIARIPLDETPDRLIERAYALAKEAAECDMLLQGQRDEGIRGMSETVDRDHDLSPASAPPRERESSRYVEIGERVAGVLASAETAADQIREDARLSADEVLSAARREAEDVRKKAAAYEADTRDAVDAYASERRREVDQEVQQQLADSEAQARATRQAAEAMARQIEEDGRRRGQALREESKAVEERLRKAHIGLRRMSAEIEQLLGPAGEEPESLVDALKPYGQRSDEDQPLVASRTTDEQ